MKQDVCVLTGDLVKSSVLKSAQLDAVMTALAQASRQIDGWGHAAPLAFERFQGDSWQMLVVEPWRALRVALYLRAAVRAACGEAETRISLAIGQAMLGAGLASSSGAAFEASGRQLDALRNRQYWVIGGEIGDRPSATLAAGLVVVCDALSQRWTARQAAVVSRLIVPAAPTMRDVADALAVQPQTVQAHFASAGGPALLDAITAFEDSFGDQ